MRARNEHANGFSLVELMVAMVCTMIVTGAIYGLLSGGQSAFRREPEMTDRQQNVRLAMDLIMRDIAAAGAGMPEFMQTFTPGLDGANFASCSECPGGIGGTAVEYKTDELEMVSNVESHPIEEACNYPGGSASHVVMVRGTTNVQEGDVVLVRLKSGRWGFRSVTAPPGDSSGASGECDSDTRHADVKFQSSGDPTGYNESAGICAGDTIPAGTTGDACTGCLNSKTGEPVPGNLCCEDAGCIVDGFLASEVIRYRIRPGTDGVPNLERFSSGRISNFESDGTRKYEVIARGIDDMQIVYTDADGDTFDDAPLVVTSSPADYGSLIQTVTVTLSSRSEAKNVAGVRTVASGPAALRGMLTSSGTPRAVLATLGRPVAERGAWIGPTPWY